MVDCLDVGDEAMGVEVVVAVVEAVGDVLIGRHKLHANLQFSAIQSG